MLKIQASRLTSPELESIFCYKYQMQVYMDFLMKMVDYSLESGKVINTMYVTIPCLKNYKTKEKIENL